MSKKKPHEKNEGNSYDKILKENSELIFKPLVEKHLGMKIISFKPLKEKIQTTLEREMDFFYEVITEKGEKFILHLEFQTQPDHEMVYRGAEYHGITVRRKKLKIHHLLINLSETNLGNKLMLPKDQQYWGFDVINIFDLKTQDFLSSQIPEFVILAILTRHPREQTETILRRIYAKLRELSNDSSQLSKYIKQLVMMSRMRKLESKATKIVTEMPLTYDYSTDYLYLKGIEEGEKNASLKLNEERIKNACNMLASGLSIEQTSEFSGLSLEKVKEIKADMT